jgi:hypothetical protein
MDALTPEEIRAGFVRATQMTMGAEARWAGRASMGLDDESLKDALAYEIGEASGSWPLKGLRVDGRGAGLRIWIRNRDWSPEEPKEPTLHGSATMRMAREVYGIGSPAEAA